MVETRLKVRLNKSAGELEIEGSEKAVAEWWEKLWPELHHQEMSAPVLHYGESRGSTITKTTSQMPEVFGEFFTEFRSDITDVDKILVAAAFIQARDTERLFTTKSANQSLIDQNIKVANASENIRRLIRTKRAFVVSDGKYRISASGLEHLSSLKISA
ncbi:MAG: hypothetical protein NTAFB05_15520 [Nitrobacter sp.]|uniref:hypothetical protein n=1 Tax=Nitrobacter sp. TaxID=29420 RepID=UPI00387DE32E